MPRLNLESLERRDAPATLTAYVSYDIGNMIHISGGLSGGSSGNYGKHLDIYQGDVHLADATTNYTGYYSVGIENANLGEIDVVCEQYAAVGVDFVVDGDIAISTFNIIERANHQVTFSGVVSYTHPMTGMGVLYGTDGTTPAVFAQANAAIWTYVSNTSGDYSITLTLNGTATDNGEMWVKAQSPWGNWSAKMYETITQFGT